MTVWLSLGLCLRFAVIAGASGFAMAGESSWSLALAISAFALSVNTRRWLSTINFINLYWLMTFVIVAPLVVPYDTTLMQQHYALIQGLITLAYNARRAFRREPALPLQEVAAPPPAIQWRFTIAWWAVIVATMALLAFEILRYGVGAWFSGAVLAEQMEAYASRDVFEALSRTARWVMTWLMFALFAFHVIYKTKLSPVGAAVGLLGMPLMAMSRQAFVFNALYLMLIARRGFRPLTVLVGIAGILLVGIGIGHLRANQLGYRSDVLEMLVRNEFSSSLAYSDLQRDGYLIGQRWGSNIVGALITAPIPRALWPDKPENGAGLYMKQYYPEALRAGYSLAINTFSDAWIAFGMWGVAVWALLIGWMYSGVDAALRLRRMTLSHHLLTFNLYLMMRTSLAHVVTLLLAQLVLFYACRAVLGLGYDLVRTGPDDRRGRLGGPRRLNVIRPQRQAGFT